MEQGIVLRITGNFRTSVSLLGVANGSSARRIRMASSWPNPVPTFPA
jgi:hypothetical protein